MAVYQTNFLGEGYLGLFGFATDKYCLISNRLVQKKIDRIEEILGVKTIQTSVSNFFLPGIMSAGNSNGVVVPYLVEEHEIKNIEKKAKVTIVPDKFTALGNLIVANDAGGMVSDVFSHEAKAVIDKALGVKTVQGRIGGSSEVGAVCLATNKGFVVTPDTTDSEMERLHDIFGVPGGRASANMGSKAVGCCAIANSHGVLTGIETTPIEMEYILEAIGFV